jgi:hypothetical protein
LAFRAVARSWSLRGLVLGQQSVLLLVLLLQGVELLAEALDAFALVTVELVLFGHF